MRESRAHKQFSGSRARFQRLRDAAIFNGWVESFDGKHISVNAATDRAVLAGDVAQFELVGFGAKAIFQAQLTDVAVSSVNADCDVQTLAGMSFLHIKSATLYFDVVGTVRVIPSDEPARLKSAGVSMRLLLPGGTISQAKIIDLSLEGVGIVSEVTLEPKSSVRFVIESHLGPVCGIGEVRYCRPDPMTTGYLRIGIRMGDLGRLDGQRWQRVIAEAA